MATDPSQSVLDDALRLPSPDRARIAHELLQSLDDDDDVVVLDERAMKAELDRRLEDARSGKAETMTVERARSFLAERKARRAR
jgi:putative addiction module component (TIGR02574 family)